MAYAENDVRLFVRRTTDHHSVARSSPIPLLSPSSAMATLFVLFLPLPAAYAECAANKTLQIDLGTTNIYTAVFRFFIFTLHIESPCFSVVIVAAAVLLSPLSVAIRPIVPYNLISFRAIRPFPSAM